MSSVIPTENSESIEKSSDFSCPAVVSSMIGFISALLSWLAGRFRGRAELELEVIALRHQLAVLCRQRPGRTRLSPLDRLLWIWLYRVWPRCLKHHGVGEADHRGPVAPSRLPALLALALKVWTAVSRSRSS